VKKQACSLEQILLACFLSVEGKKSVEAKSAEGSKIC
jgi:hypothetical protein